MNNDVTTKANKCSVECIASCAAMCTGACLIAVIPVGAAAAISATGIGSTAGANAGKE